MVFNRLDARLSPHTERDTEPAPSRCSNTVLPVRRNNLRHRIIWMGVVPPALQCVRLSTMHVSVRAQPTNDVVGNQRDT